ncbi:hypothetical protein [Dyella sp. 20L07]|uniref:hypothetical protein n=1 Tax=Dyella sp. 20L07 TaxID=3384240 RepID=UPI003D299A96
MTDSQMYRPSNGTEGASFICSWCDICERDKNQDCEILDRTMAYRLNEPEYPREWRFDDLGQPQCTAFVPEGEPLPVPRCEHTIDMFGGDR